MYRRTIVGKVCSEKLRYRMRVRNVGSGKMLSWRSPEEGRSMSDAVRLAIMCGLPKSGKSTYARGLQEAGWVRVCPDDVRRALHGRGHYPPAESLVWANAELTVRALLLSGHSVVVDATNTARRRRAPWLGIARDHEVSIEAFVLGTPAAECHERNSASDDPVPAEVIDRMNEQWEPVTEEGIAVRLIDDEAT
jgi:predicted kinase